MWCVLGMGERGQALGGGWLGGGGFRQVWWLWMAWGSVPGGSGWLGGVWGGGAEALGGGFRWRCSASARTLWVSSAFWVSGFRV